MKNVITLAAAGLIAFSVPAFAGAYGDAIVEDDVVVVEEAASSLGNVGWAILGLAVVAAIVVASDNGDDGNSTKPVEEPCIGGGSWCCYVNGTC